MSRSPQDASEAKQFGAMRDRVRGALLSKRKAEARDLLGKLVVLSADSEDRKNLAGLISGVEEEFRRYLRAHGEIRTRLTDGSPLEVIQQELDCSIPHWRAFVNDLPGLNLARIGLAPSEDPSFRVQVEGLEKRLMEGEVDPVLEDWENLGSPKAISSAGFAQTVELLSRLSRLLEEKDWGGARGVHLECTAFLEEEEGKRFQNGVETHLRRSGELIGWERLIAECSNALPNPTRGEKQRLAIALYAAIDAIKIRLSGDAPPSLAELLERLKGMQHKIESADTPVIETGSGLKWIILILLVILALLAALWLYHVLSGGGYHGHTGNLVEVLQNFDRFDGILSRRSASLAI